MTVENISLIRNKVKKSNPLIHCITNPISINQCANAILCVGARPNMAEHPKEVREITQTAQALLLNLGNITDVRMESMMISARAAKENNIPTVLDLVGISCSELRRKYAYELIKKYPPTVIKGNYSEIKALYNTSYKTVGIDAEASLDISETGKISVSLARRYDVTVLASGKYDIIANKQKLLYIKNGTPALAGITGTGCMLGALTACYLSVCSNADSAAACACAVLGICGELAQTDKGNGTFMANLMDGLSTLNDRNLKLYLKTEENQIEKL